MYFDTFGHLRSLQFNGQIEVEFRLDQIKTWNRLDTVLKGEAWGRQDKIEDPERIQPRVFLLNQLKITSD